MSRYRGQHEIMFSIMEACNQDGGERQTKMMYNAYVSHAQLKQYMKRMMEQGILEKVPLSDRYGLTGKGRRAFELFKELDGILKV